MPIAKEQSDVFLARVANATDVDWARLAAFIDGEGTIFIQRAGARGPHCLVVIVSNTSPLLTAWLETTFGGNVYFSHSAALRARSSRICYSWRVF